MRYRLLQIATGALLLAGCGQRVREVRIPVTTPCIQQSQIPAEVPRTGPLPDDARAAADVLGATILQLRATDRELRALVQGCVR